MKRLCLSPQVHPLVWHPQESSPGLPPHRVPLCFSIPEDALSSGVPVMMEHQCQSHGDEDLGEGLAGQVGTTQAEVNNNLKCARQPRPFSCPLYSVARRRTRATVETSLSALGCQQPPLHSVFGCPSSTRNPFAGFPHFC